jgi:hypothetical protein
MGRLVGVIVVTATSSWSVAIPRGILVPPPRELLLPSAPSLFVVLLVGEDPLLPSPPPFKNFFMVVNMLQEDLHMRGRIEKDAVRSSHASSNNLRLFGCSSCEKFVLVFQVSQEVRT